MASAYDFPSPYRLPQTPEAMLDLAREQMAALTERIGNLEALAPQDEIARAILDFALQVVRPVESLTRCALFLMAAKIMPGLPPQAPLTPPVTSREFIPPPVPPPASAPPAPENAPTTPSPVPASRATAPAQSAPRQFEVSATDAVTYYMSVNADDPDLKHKVEAFNARFKRSGARASCDAAEAGIDAPPASGTPDNASSRHHAGPLAARIGALVEAIDNPEPHARRLAVKLARYVAGANGEHWSPNCRLWRPREAYRRTPPPEPLRRLFAAINKASDLCRDTVYYNWPPRPPPDG